MCKGILALRLIIIKFFTLIMHKLWMYIHACQMYIRAVYTCKKVAM